MSAGIEETLERAERALAAGRGLKGTGFWKAVGKVRSDPGLAAQWGHRISLIDRAAFEAGVRLRIPATAGTAILALLTLGGLAVLALGGRLADMQVRTLAFFAAFGLLIVSTHSLAHWVVGRLVGIKFIYYFLGGPPPPRPGAKSDYESYLRTSPGKRAVMHASGAVVTKILPFALIPVAISFDVGKWPVALLVGVGLLQIATDALFSTKTSDWMKVKRELRAARALRSS
ncbi:MAG: hypothetical protein ACR2FO_02850 [Actinomycetota bacterium]